MAEKIFLIEAVSGDGLKIEFQPLPPSEMHPAGVGWGHLRLWIGNTQVWGQIAADGSEEPVEWSWVDLLEGLGRIWPWLTLEESYPIPIAPEHPGCIDVEVNRRWGGMSEIEIDNEEELMFDFLQRHNLALLLRGISLPSLFLLREGKEFVIWSSAISESVRQPFDLIVQQLERLGDYLYDLMGEGCDSRAELARKRWESRASKVAELALQVRTGMDLSELNQLFSVDGLSLPVANDNLYTDDEIFAAARMTAGCIAVDAQAQIIKHIYSVKKVDVPDLDALSIAVPDAEIFGLEGYEQGYGLATWLRDKLDLGEGVVDPEALLLMWGVIVDCLNMDPMVSAVAVWGGKHGPGVVVNSASSAKSSTKNGRRTTLAHEICHLLYDRNRSLPVADVLGGLGPRFAEKRANAFAAEFLLPRRLASELIGTEPIMKVAKRLERSFQVSPEVVMRQIRNSDQGGGLTRQERVQLEAWVGRRPGLILS